jgi:hypothetical protein
VYYEFDSREHFGYNTGIFTARVSDIIAYDSILIVNWEDGAVYRFLKVCFNRDIVEHPSPLDEMPLLKYDLEQHSFDTRKIRKVNDSILLLSNQRMVYSFIIANGAIRCVDSLLKYSPDRGGDVFDSRNDTLVIIAVPEKHAIFYSITSDGRFTQISIVKISRELDYNPMYYGLGNIYIQGLRLAALVRSDEGFDYMEGQQVYGAPHTPLFLQENIALIDISALDRIDIYSQQLEILCSKPEATSRTVLSVSNYGDKIFIARSDGITTWIPDTTTLSSSVPVLEEQNELVIWPNPSQDGNVYISCAKTITRIIITDVLGRIVHVASGSCNYTTTVRSRGLTRGTYFVTVQTGSSTATRRISVVAE